MSKLIKKWRKNMSRIKTFFKYAVWVILFFIFSEIMININLKTVYRNIGRKDNLPQVTIYQAQATKVNGRIKGTIKNQAENKIEYKSRFLLRKRCPIRNKIYRCICNERK